MENAHVGVVAKRAEGFGNEAYSTKVMEFMSQGVPVILSRTQIDTYYFKENQVCFFDSGDEKQLAKAILKVLRDKE
jgi:glycosyltransferase involved in cell wall biosynthesis